MDNMLQRQFPTVMAPRFTDMEPMTETGERFILTADKLLFEVSRPWLHAVRAISHSFERTTPYGPGLEQCITLRCDPMPKGVLEVFIEQSRQAFPKETAAWVTWDETTKEFTYVPLNICSSSTAHVKVERPILKSTEHLVLDIHSHGAHSASFSEQDDRDDRDQLCISAVLSLQNFHSPTLVARLSMLGVYTPIKELSWNTTSANT